MRPFSRILLNLAGLSFILLSSTALAQNACNVDGSQATYDSRPLCAYPEVAVYDGSGSDRDESTQL